MVAITVNRRFALWGGWKTRGEQGYSQGNAAKELSRL